MFKNMDAPDFQFIQAFSTNGDFFLPETTFQLDAYQEHIQNGLEMLQGMNDKQTDDWFINNAANLLTDIRSKEEIQEELVNSIRENENVEEESKSDVTVSSEDWEAFNAVQTDMSDSARELALVTIVFVRYLGSFEALEPRIQQVAKLVSDPFSEQEGYNEQEGEGEGENDNEQEGEGEGVVNESANEVPQNVWDHNAPNLQLSDSDSELELDIGGTKWS